MKMKKPRISVIMPVYNAESFLMESVSSILDQTFSDFELLIGDDGCTDRSIEIIRSFNDDRIIVIRNEENLGIANTLNRLIDASRGEYIARQDSDDISLPKRLEKQINFLDKNQEIGICGTNFTIFGNKRKQMFMPLQDDDIKACMLVYNPICHPTVMIRKSCLTKYYDQSLYPAEDYALWHELSKTSKLANLPDSLLNYRWHETNISTTKEKSQIEIANSIRADIFHETLAYNIEERETRLLTQVTNSRLTDYTDLLLFEKFLLKIRSKNKETGYYNERALHRRSFHLWSSAVFKLKGISLCRKITTFLLSELFTVSGLLHSLSIRNIRSLQQSLLLSS